MHVQNEWIWDNVLFQFLLYTLDACRHHACTIVTLTHKKWTIQFKMVEENVDNLFDDGSHTS